ncbi:MAG: Calx-beta domain-containing protein [Verrucomicrobiota bacterium]
MINCKVSALTSSKFRQFRATCSAALPLSLIILAGNLAIAQPTAHYRFNENSGTVISADIGPAGNLEGSGTTWSVGQIANAISLNGNGGGYVEDDTALEGNGGNNITVCFWINKSSGSQPGAVFIQKGYTNQITYSFRIQSTGDGIEYVRDRAQGGFYSRAGLSSLTPGQWYHVAGTYNRNQNVQNCTATNSMEIFINGVSLGTRSSSGDLTNNSGRFTIGSQSVNGGGFNQRFQGKVDDVGVWDMCLSYKKIAAIYAMGRFEGIDCNDARVDSFLSAFTAGGQVVINGHPWSYTTGLAGGTGSTGGTAGVDAWVILDANGNGMQTIQPPSLTITQSGADLLLSWIGLPGLYNVQFRPDLPNSPAWAFITNQVTSVGATNTVRMKPPGIHGYCRLAQQSSSSLDLLMQCDVGDCGVLQTGWTSLPTCGTYPNVNGSGINVTLASGVPAACACRDRTGSGPLADVEKDFLFSDNQIGTPGGDFTITFENLMPGIFYRLHSYHNRTDQSPSYIQGVVVSGAAGATAPTQIYQDHSIMDAPAETFFTAVSNQVSIRFIAPTQAEAGSGAQAFLNGFTLERAPIMVWQPTVQFETSFSSGLETISLTVLNVVLSEALPQTTTVNYAVTAGTATGGGVDFTLPAGTLTFAPGMTDQPIPISIVNDGVNENDETIEVNLSHPTGGATLGFWAKHLYTIVDPRPKVSFTLDSSSGLESVSPAKISVNLSSPSTNIVTVNFAVTGGTATGGGVDYTLANGALSFIPGQVSTNINLTVVNDMLSESNETVVVTLSNPNNAMLGTITQHAYTIIDDDSGLQWNNLSWFYNIAPTRLFINASNQLEWNPEQGGQFITRLPDQRLSQTGDKVQLVYYWLTDGDYGNCPDCFACINPGGQDHATCSDFDIHCIAGTSDMRIGLFQSDGEYITADGYNVASNSIFAGYKGYSFRFGPNMLHDPGTNANPVGSGRWVDCRPEVHKTGAFHKKPAALANLMYSNDNQKDYIYGFNLPPGQFSLLTVSLERLSPSSVKLSITLNGLTQTWTDTSSSEQPTNINVLAFHMRNGRPYSRLVLSK